ncbi:uncharacterized protein CANTADRAFT_259888 [Suhomyces tanzawaensis NRRL Y-17324]|uniref:Uncharacterized protein n=1 Tax=Suhomyces tanzawaensis NRRL Y-17324 TaxID=984487 RepID=A0A1E4SIY9_9ASCO|nr:uncharacterized protein CANTADRAFT_259888 [Suhomyces tanzawaensis NRRL Y-17324]ODV79476.1 hypothetical protein CANTADRAFT_259888 [Suhomyces tanzawaensis NRRL Y-17324]
MSLSLVWLIDENPANPLQSTPPCFRSSTFCSRPSLLPLPTPAGSTTRSPPTSFPRSSQTFPLLSMRMGGTILSPKTTALPSKRTHSCTRTWTTCTTRMSSCGTPGQPWRLLGAFEPRVAPHNSSTE